MNISRRIIFYFLLLTSYFLLTTYHFSFLLAQAPDTLWTKMYGAGVGYSVQQTTDLGYIVAGYTDSSTTQQVYIIKTDHLGNPIWTKTYGDTTMNCCGYSIKQTSDGGYIVAGVSGTGGFWGDDVYLIKTDANGDTMWTRNCRGNAGYSVHQTSDGGYIIAGHAWWATTGDDVYLVKTNANGFTSWAKRYNQSSDYLWGDYGRSVQQTSDGGYIVVGWTHSWSLDRQVYLIKTDANGDTLWTRTYGREDCSEEGYSVQQTADGGYIIAGGTSYFSNAIYLIKTDANGDTLWTKMYGGNADCGYSIQPTWDGGYIIAGKGTWSHEIYIMKIDVNGDSMWTKSLHAGGGALDAGHSVQQTFDRGYIIGGERNLEACLIRLAPDTFAVQETQTVNPSPIDLEIYPNPFRKQTKIRYTPAPPGGARPGIQDAGYRMRNTSLKIYDATGQIVREFNLKSEIANLQSAVSWNGMDGSNRKLPAGIYFVRLSAGSYSDIKKIILIK